MVAGLCLQLQKLPPHGLWLESPTRPTLSPHKKNWLAELIAGHVLVFANIPRLPGIDDIVWPQVIANRLLVGGGGLRVL